jgi:hypothetical protein
MVQDPVGFAETTHADAMDAPSACAVPDDLSAQTAKTLSRVQDVFTLQ